MKKDLGVIGLAVMGQNLILNMAEKGYRVAAYNRTPEKTEEFLSQETPGKGEICGYFSLKDLCASLALPRKILLMVKAGPAVDQVVEELLPYLNPGDIILDGGNSHFSDTERREKQLSERGILFVGTGISGGEEGARRGPSIMPGGNREAWPHLKEILLSLAAKTDSGEPCCTWIGPGGAGHFVKMVHNGIEYGDMQLLAETWHLLRSLTSLKEEEIAETFSAWNRDNLESYLVEITAEILKTREPGGKLVLESILDSAGQKGTGLWTSAMALENYVPLTLITEAVFARNLSSLVEERRKAEGIIRGNLSDGVGPGRGSSSRGEPAKDKKLDQEMVEALGQALLCAKIISYAQGFLLMRRFSEEKNWSLEYGEIAKIWRGGCIIRSSFLNRIAEAYERDPQIESLLLDPWFEEILYSNQPGWRLSVMRAAQFGIPTPALSSGLAFFDGYRCGRLPANLIQAQRDYFGAHTYERIDRPRGEFYHTRW